MCALAIDSKRRSDQQQDTYDDSAHAMTTTKQTKYAGHKQLLLTMLQFEGTMIKIQ